MDTPLSPDTTVTPTSIGLNPARTDRQGYTRRKSGKGFTYLDCQGNRLSDKKTARCRELAIPPAWRNVWIAPSEKAHIQAYGTDDADRRQYIYHPAWQDARQHAKFEGLLSFGDNLPRIRSRVHTCLREADCETELSVCTVIGFLDAGSLRVGSKRYLEKAGTIGATTLMRRHIQITSDHLELDFPAKGGKQRHVELHDPDLIDAVSSLLENASRSANAELIHVSPAQVNRWLVKLTGEHFTAKHFRTWNGSVAASEALYRLRGKATVKAVTEAAADILGNTPAIAKSSYIHPRVLEAINDPPEDWPVDGPTRLRAPERRLYGLLKS